MALLFHEPFLPRELLSLATKLAAELDRPVMSDDLLLLAVGELDSHEPARQALDAADVSAARVLDEIRGIAGDAGELSQRTGVSFPPRMYTLAGLAWGFAATLGDGIVTPEYVLLAILWSPTSAGSSVLRRLGVERETVISHLKRLRVPIPASPLPVARELQWGQRVWVDRDQLKRVLDYLGHRLPLGTEWGFNYEGDRAWVIAERRVALKELCAVALNDQTPDQ